MMRSPCGIALLTLQSEGRCNYSTNSVGQLLYLDRNCYSLSGSPSLAVANSCYRPLPTVIHRCTLQSTEVHYSPPKYTVVHLSTSEYTLIMILFPRFLVARVIPGIFFCEVTVSAAICKSCLMNNLPFPQKRVFFMSDLLVLHRPHFGKQKNLPDHLAERLQS